VLDSGHVLVSHGDGCFNGWRLTWEFWIDALSNGNWNNTYYRADWDAPMPLGASRFSVLDTDHVWHLGLHYSTYHAAVRTISGGGAWEPFANPYDAENNAYDASFTDTATGWAVWNVVYKTASAGDSWRTLTTDLGARRIQMFDSLNGWIMTTSGLMRTTNGGDSWTTAVSQSGLQALRFCNARNGVAVGSGGMILRTIDSGSTWLSDTAEDPTNLYCVCRLDSAHAWAAGDSGVVLGLGDWALPGVEDSGRKRVHQLMLTSVGPNPCRGALWLHCRGGSGSVVVYDDCGRPVRSLGCAMDHPERIDLRDLPAGVYFARVASSPQNAIRFVLLR
jgi:hypothetical protein